MPKRFTDTGIWVDKPWFIDLSPSEKCAWFFITARCDNVGVWKPNYKIAELTIGEKVDWEALLEKLNSNVEVLENGKWWLPDFCDFQYGELKPTNKPHLSYIRLLEKHDLLYRIKGYPRGIHAPKEKEKDKELEKELEKEKDKSGTEAKECLDCYFATHKEVRGYEPTIVGGRDIKLFKTLLKNYDVPAVKEVIQTFFGWDKRSDFTTRALYNRFDVLYGVLKDKAEGRR